MSKIKEFELKFEFYGKNLKTKVKAYDIEMAKDIVRKRVNFIGVEEKKGFEDFPFDSFSSIFNNKK